MKTSLIAHAVLALGNVGVFIALTGGQGFQPIPQAGWGVPVRQEAALTPASGDFNTALVGLLKEQALLREELGRLKSQAGHQPVSAPQTTAADGGCQNPDADNAPGVTVYLETTPPEAPPSQAAQPAQQQWTAVSFKEVGPARDGSKQAVMSIQSARIDRKAAGFLPVRTPPRWQ